MTERHDVIDVRCTCTIGYTLWLSNTAVNTYRKYKSWQASCLYSPFLQWAKLSLFSSLSLEFTIFTKSIQRLELFIWNQDMEAACSVSSFVPLNTLTRKASFFSFFEVKNMHEHFSAVIYIHNGSLASLCSLFTWRYSINTICFSEGKRRR